MQNSDPSKYQKATLGAGCYWCIEAMYRQVPGIIKIVSGFTEGSNRAEVVHITFDPSQVTFLKLLKCLFRMHDCTDPRMGSGLERSIVTFHNNEQKEIITKFIAELNSRVNNSVVTDVRAFPGFQPAGPGE